MTMGKLLNLSRLVCSSIKYPPHRVVVRIKADNMREARARAWHWVVTQQILISSQSLSPGLQISCACL